MQTEVFTLQAEEYAKGLLAIGLIPGEDTLTVIGCPSMQGACLFTACSAVGIGYAVSYHQKSFQKIAPMKSQLSPETQIFQKV